MTVIFQSILRRIICDKNKPVLIPTLPIVDIETLKESIDIYMSNDRLDYYESTKLGNLELESGFSEYWIAKASDGERIGNGNHPVDVKTNDGKMIDVMCLCLNGNYTNEKSVIQKFKSTGINLDNNFTNEALSKFMQDYSDKLSKINEDIYYVVLISTNQHVYMSTFKLRKEYIKNIIATKIISKSIMCKNFTHIGQTKLYKSKKRFEVRFHRDILECFNTIQVY